MAPPHTNSKWCCCLSVARQNSFSKQYSQNTKKTHKNTHIADTTISHARRAFHPKLASFESVACSSEHVLIKSSARLACASQERCHCRVGDYTCVYGCFLYAHMYMLMSYCWKEATIGTMCVCVCVKYEAPIFFNLCMKSFGGVWRVFGR